MSMFCYQCEQTAKGTGCDQMGVCGKDESTAALLDLLVQEAKEIAAAAEREGVHDPDIVDFLLEALFVSVTNVNFDPEHIAKVYNRGAQYRERIGGEVEEGGACCCGGGGGWGATIDIGPLVEKGREYSIAKRREQFGETVAGLQELVLYGLKGAAAYYHHAAVLGHRTAELDAAFQKCLAFLADDPTDGNALLGEAMNVGKINLDTMALLDSANTTAYGTPEPTEVRVTPIAGKCILVSGHDLKDLDMLLKQTQGRDINVYTHGEMLPCLAYPELKKYPHLVGNYGGAWQDQAKEFDEFPGAILMTTNCIQKPRDSYKGRIFTSGLVGWPGVKHIDFEKDFEPVIEAALAAPGFTEDAPEKKIMIGFAADAVLGVAETVINAVKSGAIRHFFLVGGCDGAKSGRNYYTEFAQAVPDDCVILTLACGKYRFNKLEFGDIGGVPRLLDVGQCNDAYSAIRIATALADAFKCGVNDLPLSMILSWYEQKAVAILLTLLHLGITGIRLGPSLPAFVTPKVLDALVQKFQIAPIGDPNEDLAACLA